MTKRSTNEEGLCRDIVQTELGLASMLLLAPDRCGEVDLDDFESEALREVVRAIDAERRAHGAVDLVRLGRALPERASVLLAGLLGLELDSSADLNLLQMMEMLERRRTSAAHLTPTVAEHRALSRRLRAHRGAERVKRAAVAGDVPPDLLRELGASEDGVHVLGDAAEVVSFSEVEPVVLTWLYPNVLPAKKLVTLMGDPGVGKGLLWIDLAARTTTGCGWPCNVDNPNPPGDVVVLSSEDGLADTLVPRFIAAGGDRLRMKAIKGIKTKAGDQRGFSLDRDLGQLEEVLSGCERPALVVVDPIGSYIGAINTNTDAEVRTILSPLADLAETYGVTILIVAHMNKKEGIDPAYRAMGSLAFTGVSRMVWVLAKDREDPTGNRRVLAPVKANVGRGFLSYAFDISSSDELSTPSLRWEPEPVEIDTKVLLAPGRGAESKRRERDEAKDLLRELLRSPTPVTEIMEAAQAQGLSVSTVRRARTDLGVETRKEGFEGGQWVWFLPNEIQSDDEGDQPQNGTEEEGDHLREELNTFGRKGITADVRASQNPSPTAKMVTRSTQPPSRTGDAENGFEYADELGGGAS